MNWSDLRVFLAVAQTGSLRQAAKTLGVTQPTVSRHLQNLEADIGLPLFERDREGHRLSPAGADLLPEIRAVESAVLRVEQRSNGLARHLAEKVRIGAGETSAAVLARGLHLLGDGPRVELMITDATQRLQARQPDILVTHGMPTTEAGLTRRIGAIGCAVYGLETFAEGRTVPLSRKELMTLPWIGFIEEQEHYVTMTWLRETMRGRPPVARLMNSDLMIAAAAAGVGVAVLPCFKGDKEPRLSRLSPEIEPLRADYWTLIQPELSRNGAIRAATDWIRDCFRAIEGDSNS